MALQGSNLLHYLPPRHFKLGERGSNWGLTHSAAQPFKQNLPISSPGPPPAFCTFLQEGSEGACVLRQEQASGDGEKDFSSLNVLSGHQAIIGYCAFSAHIDLQQRLILEIPKTKPQSV